MQRYILVALILTLAGVAVVGKAVYIMTAEKDFWMKVSKKFVKENKEEAPTRGNILACNGEVLASSIPEYKIYMDFMSCEGDSLRRMKEQNRRDSILMYNLDSICKGVQKVLPDVDPHAFRQLLIKGREEKSKHKELYPHRITYIQYRQLKTLPLFELSPNWGGFHVEKFKTRKNPYGRLAIRTIGDLYKGKDSARTGIELSFDSILRGKPGISHRQKVLNRYLSIIDKPAEDGCDVMLTIDVGMQDIVEKALADKLSEIEAQSGVCILMEVATGDIKAMSSLTRLSDGTYSEINADAVKNLYEPGSVFKPMSFLVGMDDGYIQMTDEVDVGNGQKLMYGRKMRDANWRSGGSGVVTVPQILQKSLNVGVSTLIDRHYHNQPEKFVEGIYRIGVAEDLKIPIPGYAKPRIRMPAPDGSNWYDCALPWMSIGYETQIPPITTINFYNGIANNGKLLRPRLVKAILKDGQIVEEFPTVVLREQMAKPEVVKNMQECLESVVSVGLGGKARSKYFGTAGKTGTAQIWTSSGFASEYLISFAGYFPTDQPLYSCIVCIRKHAPASGGGMCAPVFKRVAETVMGQRRTDDFSTARDTIHGHLPVVSAGNMNAAIEVLEELNIDYISNIDTRRSSLTWGTYSPDNARPSLSSLEEERADLVPDVHGYGLRDALFKLEKLGLRVKVEGAGFVRRQSLLPGSNYSPGDEIVLSMGPIEEVPKQTPPMISPAVPSETPVPSPASPPSAEAVPAKSPKTATQT